MGSREKLVQLRAQAFRRIEEAAKKGHTDQVNRLARIPKECEGAMELLQSLDAQIARIEVELQRSNAQPLVGQSRAGEEITKSPGHASRPASPRRRANEVRTAYLDDLSHKRGTRLRRRSEVTYETQSGKSVGIPYATELADLPDRWWLGLPDEHFDFVILLCGTGPGRPLDFILPSDFVSEVWNSLSRDSKRHVKLNVFKSGGDYELRLRDGVGKRIGRFCGACEILS